MNHDPPTQEPTFAPRPDHPSRAQIVCTMAGLMLSLLLAAMDQTIVGTAMPRVIASLNGFNRYPWVTTAFMLTSTITVPIVARLSDLFGRKWLYLYGVALFVAASWLCGAAGRVPVPLDGMNQLIVFRGLQGIGGGAIFGLTFTIIGDLFSPAERGRYQGLISAVFGFASVVGPGVGGWITDHLSWRWAFYVNAPLGLIAVAVLYFTFPQVAPSGALRVIDWLGCALLCGWLVPLLLALSWVSESGWGAQRVWGTLVAAGLLLAVFLAAERRAVEPLIPLTMFRTQAIAIACAGVFLLGLGMFGMFVYMPLFLQGVLGASASRAGSLMIPLTLSVAVASMVSGQIISRTLRYKFLAVGGAAAVVVGMLLLAAMGPDVSHWQIVRNMLVCGLGLGVMQPVYTLIAQNASKPGELGAATGTVQFCRSIGSAIGVAVFGSLLLRVYHGHFHAVIPHGTPLAMLRPFENPLLIVRMKAQIYASFAHVPDGQALLATLFGGVRDGLTAGLRLVFLLGAIVTAGMAAVNLAIREVPLRKTRH